MAETSSRQGPGSPWTVVPEMMMMNVCPEMHSKLTICFFSKIYPGISVIEVQI